MDVSPEDDGPMPAAADAADAAEGGAEKIKKERKRVGTVEDFAQAFRTTILSRGPSFLQMKKLD